MFDDALCSFTKASMRQRPQLIHASRASVPDQLRVENNRPFEMLLDPEINANALNWARDSNKARTPANDSAGKG